MDQARLALDFIDTLVWPLAVVGLVFFSCVDLERTSPG